MDVFSEIRERVPAIEIARMVGLEVNEKGFCKCPFHKHGGERTASLQFSPDGLRWRCYGCGEGGSSIDFTMLFFHLDVLGAAKKLNRDFALNVPGLEDDHKPTQQERQEMQHRKETDATFKAFERWRTDFANQLDAVHRRGWEVTHSGRHMDTWTDAEAVAVRHIESAVYFEELLTRGTAEDALGIFRQREVIGEWIARALRP